jgi:hypothetical protein
MSRPYFLKDSSPPRSNLFLRRDDLVHALLSPSECDTRTNFGGKSSHENLCLLPEPGVEGDEAALKAAIGAEYQDVRDRTEAGDDG